MRKSRFLLVAILVSALAGACSSPTAPYPTPDKTKEDPQPPKPGLVRTNG